MAALLRWVRLVSGREILLLDLDSIGLVGRPVAQRRVRTPLIVEVDPATDAGLGLAAGLEGVQKHALVFERKRRLRPTVLVS